MRPDDLEESEADEEHQGAGLSGDSTIAFGQVTTEPMRDEPGRRIDGDESTHEELDLAFAGRYDLGEVLGRGGFGIVYRGFDRRLGRPVAIKLSRLEGRSGGEMDPLLREARRAAQLQHPGIVTVHDVGVANGRCMIVSELLDGAALDEWARRRKPGWAEVAGVVAGVAEALAHAHSRGIIHRDVKPSNIVVVDRDRPILLDLGLALSDLDARSGGGQVMGTLSYMSPEQSRGEGHQPDGRTDIYSLGVVLYELLAGRKPYQARDARDLIWQLSEIDPQPPRQVRPEIPAELERICLKAMSRHPKDRHSTAGDLAAELRRAAQGRAPTPEPEPPPPTAQPRASEAPPAPSRGPERRQLTVLLCLLRPAPGEADAGGPDDFEEEHGRLVALRRMCESIVADRGGLALPSDGGSFLACFGYPTSREDAPRLAVAAGLEILRVAVATVGGASGLRLGVETGQVVIGSGGAGGAPTILGDAVAGVDRLAKGAAPNELLIGGTTGSLVLGFFDCQEVAGSPATAPGRPATYRVLAGRDARNRVEATGPDRLTPLIGRALEVELLKERWERAKEGDGHVLMLVADPGLGKSRLVHVMKERLAGDEGASADSTIEWYGSEHHRNSPLQPAIDYYLRAFGLAGLPNPEARLDALVARLEARGFADPAVHALFASLLSVPAGGRLPPLEMSPDRIKERSLELSLEWLDRESARGPVLFIVEDLHWFDPTTLELLRMFVDGGSGSRGGLLAIFTTRPEFDPPWKGKDNLTSVALTRFNRRQVVEMMVAQTGVREVPAAVVDQILERTDGVPLFVEEFTRMLAESRPTWANPDASVNSSSSLQLASIPATLQDLLVARLDRVAGNKALIQLGATIGRSFDFEMISAVADLDESTLGLELGKLVEVGMLFVKGAPPRSTYTFKHALIQDSAYQLLLKKPRQQFHRRIAEALEARFPDSRQDRPELLAHHFSEAGLAPRAIDYWLLAGQRSRERSAHIEALDHLSRGLNLIGTMPPSAARDALELSFRLPMSSSTVAIRGYASPEVEEHNRRARELCDALGGDSPYFPITMVIWAIRFIQGRMAEAGVLVGELIDLAEAGDDGLKVEAHWAACCHHYWAGDFEASLRHGRRSIGLYQVGPSIEHARFTSQNSGPLARAFSALAAWTLGDPVEARRLADEAMTLAEELLHPFTFAVVLFHSGYLDQLAGDAPAALAKAERVIALSKEQAFPFYAGLGSSLKGTALGMMGRHDQAIPLLIEGMRVVESTGSDKLHPIYLQTLADSLWAVGRRGEAWATLDRALAINDRDQEHGMEAEMYRRRGEFLNQQGEPEAGEASLLRSIEVARSQKARFFELRSASALAGLRVARGRPALEASGPLREALAGLGPTVEAPEVDRATALLERLG